MGAKRQMMLDTYDQGQGVHFLRLRSWSEDANPSGDPTVHIEVCYSHEEDCNAAYRDLNEALRGIEEGTTLLH